MTKKNDKKPTQSRPAISNEQMTKIRVQSFWLEEDFPPLGYGGHYLAGPLFIFSGLLAIVCILYFNFLFQAPNILIQMLSTILGLVWVIPAYLGFRLFKRYQGYYRLTNQGRPYAFYSQTPPKGLATHRRMKKAQFLRAIEFAREATQASKKK